MFIVFLFSFSSVFSFLKGLVKSLFSSSESSETVRIKKACKKMLEKATPGTSLVYLAKQNGRVKPVLAPEDALKRLVNMHKAGYLEKSADKEKSNHRESFSNGAV